MTFPIYQVDLDTTFCNHSMYCIHLLFRLEVMKKLFGSQAQQEALKQLIYKPAIKKSVLIHIISDFVMSKITV